MKFVNLLRRVKINILLLQLVESNTINKVCEYTNNYSDAGILLNKFLMKLLGPRHSLVPLGYSGTPLKRTPLGPMIVSAIARVSLAQGLVVDHTPPIIAAN